MAILHIRYTTGSDLTTIAAQELVRALVAYGLNSLTRCPQPVLDILRY